MIENGGGSVNGIRAGLQRKPATKTAIGPERGCVTDQPQQLRNK